MLIVTASFPISARIVVDSFGRRAARGLTDLWCHVFSTRGSSFAGFEISEGRLEVAFYTPPQKRLSKLCPVSSLGFVIAHLQRLSHTNHLLLVSYF